MPRRLRGATRAEMDSAPGPAAELWREMRRRGGALTIADLMRADVPAEEREGERRRIELRLVNLVRAGWVDRVGWEGGRGCIGRRRLYSARREARP